MADTLTPARRSWNMAQVRARDTAPEMTVRRLAHALGYRFRLHRRDLPGKPDLVFPRWRLAMFVHGCFWHSHQDARCADARKPKSNRDYWLPKLEGNRARDARNAAALERLGWRVAVVWECESRDRAALGGLLERAIEGDMHQNGG